MQSTDSEERIHRLYDLLGENTVLIPIPKRQKGPRLKGWQSLTIEQTRTEQFRKKLFSHANTGVLLGAPSHALCSIDIDSDSEIERFLQSNPNLKTSLQSRGERGGNIWIQLKGDYPKLTKLKSDSGEPWGEWRSDGGLTVISGIHPAGSRYRITVEEAPKLISFEDITWPPGVIPPHSPSTSSEQSTNLHHSAESRVSEESTSSTSQQRKEPSKANPKNHAEKIRIACLAEKNLETKSPAIAKLYRRYVADRIAPVQGKRNAAVVAMIKFLSYTVSPTIALKLAEYFYDLNLPTWIDSKAQHMREAAAQLGAVLETFREELTVSELEIYEMLNEPQKDCFRICRDLAHRNESEEFPPPKFFLSCEDLGMRLGIHTQAAQRILRRFETFAILKTVQKGARREAGKRPCATVWSWELSENIDL